MFWFDMMLILSLVFIALLLLAIVLIPIIYAFVKKKYWLIIIPFVLAGCIALYCYLFPTRFPYADPWIMGKTQDQIIALYGEPTGKGWVSEGCIAYDLGKDNGFFGVMDSPNHIYYYIYFDAEGRAYKVAEGGPRGG